MSFVTTTQVRFAHVDAAGIVFYPRYFEMLNGAVEDWFAAMGMTFHAMHIEQKIGTPLARLDCDFASPSMLGDKLTFTLVPTSVGRSSCPFTFVVTGEGQVRFKGSGVLVCIDLVARQPVPWPPQLRDAMVGYTADGAVSQAAA